MAVRRGTVDDVDSMVALSAQHRRQLESWAPRFWRVHPDADARQRAWFTVLVGDPNHLVLVDDAPPGVDGFVIGRLLEAPPVYDPGGRTCLIDDAGWVDLDAGERLLREAIDVARRSGVTQLVAVTAAADAERRGLFARVGLQPTSEWWSTGLPDGAGGARP